MSNMINLGESCQRHHQTELSELELGNIVGGSKSAGTGKVTFNSFSITKHVDKASPQLFL